jgi:hypothetical protein
MWIVENPVNYTAASGLARRAKTRRWNPLISLGPGLLAEFVVFRE